MQKILLFSFMIAGFFTCSVNAQTIVVSFQEEHQDTLYVYNGDFLYDHSGTGSTQIFAECIGTDDCRLFFRFNGEYNFITNSSIVYATTMNEKYSYQINNWSIEEIPFSGIVYTFDIPITDKELNKFGTADLLRFEIGNYLFTTPENIQYGFDRLSSRISTANTENVVKESNAGLDFEFGSVTIHQEEHGNFLLVQTFINNDDTIKVLSPTENYLIKHPDFDPTKANSKQVLSYLQCNTLPEDGLFNEDGELNLDNQWVLPFEVITYRNNSSVDISDYTNLNINPTSKDGANYIGVAYKVPEKHTHCDIFFLGTKSNMDSLLIIHEND